MLSSRNCPSIDGLSRRVCSDHDRVEGVHAKFAAFETNTMGGGGAESMIPVSSAGSLPEFGN